MMDNNDNNANLLIQEAEFRLQFLCESLDNMTRSWGNRLYIHIDMLEEKICSMSQEREIVVNAGSNLEYIDLYEHDNYLELYKIIV